MDITEFLNARIDEDEQAAQSRDGLAPIHQTGCYYYDHSLDAGWYCDCEGPDRAVKEAAAKRAIVDGSQTLVALASVYSGHPDFDTAWVSK